MKLSQSTSNGTFRHITIQRVHYICNKSKRGEEQTSSTDWEVMAMCLVADSAIEAIRDSASHHTFLFFFCLPHYRGGSNKRKNKLSCSVGVMQGFWVCVAASQELEMD